MTRLGESKRSRRPQGRLQAPSPPSPPSSAPPLPCLVLCSSLPPPHSPAPPLIVFSLCHFSPLFPLCSPTFPPGFLSKQNMSWMQTTGWNKMRTFILTDLRSGLSLRFFVSQNASGRHSRFECFSCLLHCHVLKIGFFRFNSEKHYFCHFSCDQVSVRVRFFFRLSVNPENLCVRVCRNSWIFHLWFLTE